MSFFKLIKKSIFFILIYFVNFIISFFYYFFIVPLKYIKGKIRKDNSPENEFFKYVKKINKNYSKNSKKNKFFNKEKF